MVQLGCLEIDVLVYCKLLWIGMLRLDKVIAIKSDKNSKARLQKVS